MRQLISCGEMLLRGAFDMLLRQPEFGAQRGKRIGVLYCCVFQFGPGAP
jgi:hypothetical protein